MRKLLLRCKVYLHPKINEHFGISIVEAMSCGCLPVVHNSGGPREFVPKDFRFDEMREAALKIDKAIENWSSQEAWKISKYAKKFSENSFSEEFTKLFNYYFN